MVFTDLVTGMPHVKAGTLRAPRTHGCNESVSARASHAGRGRHDWVRHGFLGRLFRRQARLRTSSRSSIVNCKIIIDSQE